MTWPQFFLLLGTVYVAPQLDTKTASICAVLCICASILFKLLGAAA